MKNNKNQLMNIVESKIFFIILLIICSLQVNAQEDIKKEVRVVKAYQPTLSDAHKLNILPQLDDSIKFYPDIRYDLTPSKVNTEFELRQIKPAKMVPQALEKYYRSYLKIGLGNYLTPLAEININSLRSKDFQYGFHASHISSSGKVKLENNHKVKAPYADNDVFLFGKKILKHAEINGRTGLQSMGSAFYGYSPDTLIKFDTDSIKQRYVSLYALIDISSLHTDSNKINYKARAFYDYTYDIQNFNEHFFNLNLNTNTYYKGFQIGVATDIEYMNYQLLDTSTHSVVEINPWLRKSSEEWRFKLGLNATFETVDGSTNTMLFPQAELQFDIIPKILVPYIGLNGNLDAWSFKEIAHINPFITPGLKVESTKHRAMAYGGLKGKLSSENFFNISAQYGLADHHHFFVNDTSVLYNNTFGVVYDDIELAIVSGEFLYKWSEKLDFKLKGDWYSYKMNEEEKPWHLPTLKLLLGGRYNMQDKIIGRVDIIAENKRFAKPMNDLDKPIELNGIVDVNLGVDYLYNDLLTGFIKINNLFGQKYQQWNYYPNHRFFIMVGFSYSL